MFSTASRTAVELMVAKDSPDAHRCGQTAQDRKQFLPGLTVSFKDISEQYHEVGLLRLHLTNTRLQPLLAKQRTEVQI